MITWFNRRELAVVFSVQEQTELRSRLHDAGLDYAVRTVNRARPGPFADGRAHTGTLGMNLDAVYEYCFYVRRADYAAALAAIGRG